MDLLECVRVGVHHDFARRAVHGDDRAGRDDHAGVVQARDGRHVDGARQNRGVVRPTPCVRDERGEPLPVELRDHRGGHLVGHEDQRSFDVLEEVGRIA
jgi:hypothetical protein